MKEYQSTVSIPTILKKSDHLGKLCAHISKISKLNKAVSCLLSPELAEHCTVANLKDGIVILATDSAVWHHKLRFITGDLLAQLRKKPKWCFIKSIQVKVALEDPVIIIKKPEPRKISKVGVECLELAKASLYPAGATCIGEE